jgi:plastocyanin
VNLGKHNHNVSSFDGKWGADLPPGAAYAVTFPEVGAYYYSCRHHRNMRGTIIVIYGGATSSDKPVDRKISRLLEMQS